MIQKSLIFDSGKVVVFIQVSGPLVSFLYFFGVGFMHCRCRLFKLLNFSGKIVTSFANNFPMQKPLFKNIVTLDKFY